MVRGRVNVSVKDNTLALKKLLGELANSEVYVGIPEEESSRPGSGKINNAELAYIHTHGVRRADMRHEMAQTMVDGTAYSRAHQMYLQEHGSPLLAIPARPIIEPAIEKNKDAIANEMKKAVRLMLDGDVEGAKAQLDAVGLTGQNVVRAWFTDPANGWANNSPDTIEQKKGANRPLIDTGELRKSITYVVGEK